MGLGNILKTSSPEGWPNEVKILGVFSYFSNAYLISYGQEIINPKLSLGLTLKYLNSDMFQIQGGQAYGYSLTPGLLYQPSSNLTLGLKIDELLNAQKWATGALEQVPPKLRLGAAYKLQTTNYKLLLSADLSQLLKPAYSPEFCLGAELNLKDKLFLRGGLNDSTLTAGVGFRVDGAEVNYAYVTQPSLSKENVHRISISGRW